ncbi:adenosylmethionine--8-amino-7-oxononanoate transaminase [Simiduia aestuariiviva]|uniref:Adenosylmethionine-8-amino-7-oxononanoate aminotransferase n=1 Tax=Simiduia aestuariiviva TaxID=1510459 RepID=A0A839UP26_9GAMM|nr:adenosylmethionine--8-amino-7-oxononanoate transaminase [Simiduia aestuariiviva]MBB3168481.1 adenosylmethionine-8-amino-7-oxononanoate aminotransferase [Simiduia aestuariiviva]
MDTDSLLALDRQLLWHPYSSFNNPPPVYPVRAAQGVYIELSDGRKLIDGMSSWWCVLHGYNHPAINQAIKDQVDKVSHVMFGGFTHEPAVSLAQKLVALTPEGLNKVFLADSGSVSVEVALKMALQFWRSKGQPQKTRMLALHNGYHGDTFGAMAVCDPVTGMHHLFADAMPQHLFAPSPSCGFNEPCDDEHIQPLRELIQQHHTTLAALILEPIVQGAGGMRFYSPQYLKAARALCDEYGLLLIADEIATGFGRTGKMFACEHAGISPDILCLGKGLTGGYMTLAATLCNDRVAQGICDGEAGVFMHGPTFMGNPLACAAANASLTILTEQDWQSRVATIEQQLREGLAPCRDLPEVAEVRVLGTIGVVEMTAPVDMAVIQRKFVDQGVWVRPFGRLVYVMPPLIINDKELALLTSALCRVLANS